MACAISFGQPHLAHSQFEQVVARAGVAALPGNQKPRFPAGCRRPICLPWVAFAQPGRQARWGLGRWCIPRWRAKTITLSSFLWPHEGNQFILVWTSLRSRAIWPPCCLRVPVGRFSVRHLRTVKSSSSAWFCCSAGGGRGRWVRAPTRQFIAVAASACAERHVDAWRRRATFGPVCAPGRWGPRNR